MNNIQNLIDTHTHFDFSEFDDDRYQQLQLAMANGVQHLVIAGYVNKYFQRLINIQQDLNQFLFNQSLNQSVSQNLQATLTPESLVSSIQPNKPSQIHIALGLHPAFIAEHQEHHLTNLDQLLSLHRQRIVALGEIGLDSYSKILKTPEVLAKQKHYFIKQLDLANKYQLPVLLHIRKSHAESLKVLKQHTFDCQRLGGIAHSFSGGEQEAKAFVKLGFKLGITGQICNPHAKKLRKAILTVVKAYGLSSIVIETDCPDMLPFNLYQDMSIVDNMHHTHTEHTHTEHNHTSHLNRNTPANIIYVLEALGKLLDIDQTELAEQLWENSCDVLNIS